MEGDYKGRNPATHAGSSRYLDSDDVADIEVDAAIPVEEHRAQISWHNGITRSDIDALVQLKSLRKVL